MRNIWFLRGWRKYVTSLVLAGDIGLGGFSTAMALSATTGGVAVTTPSAITVPWTADRQTYDPSYIDPARPDPNDPNQPLYKNLQVTISQTKDLTDQGLQVSWTGGAATGGSGAPGNYLQIMQCWASKGSSGPTPEQCQWGAPNTAIAGQMGAAAASRDLLTGALADPAQLPNGTCPSAYTHAQVGQRPGCTIPFWSITDPAKASLGWANDQYNLPPYGAAQSNEVSYARTAADGTGQYIFNLQSALTSPYLGCGNASLAAQGDTCWLVVVPRGQYNLNGDLASSESQDSGYGTNYDYVAGSPLSASAWRDRIQIPLHFSTIGASCKVGAATVRTAGTELVSGAFNSWQSALCAQGTTFGYSEITDDQARTTLAAGGNALSFMIDRPTSTSADGGTTKYAPVTASGIVISYLIDKNYTQDTTNPDYGANGTLVTNLRLTPLIVAKLLTQSYRVDTPGDGHGVGATVPASNPDSLLQDQDFLALNPDFKYFYPTQIPDGLIVPFGSSDAAKAVWAWLRSDPTARAFLEGTPEDGATINKAYLGLNLGTDAGVNSFPKNDQSTFKTGDWPAPGYGTLDMRPYAGDFAAGAYRTVTANSGKKITWDITLTPPQATSVGAQVPGTRFEMAITTSEAAALDGLPTAALVSSPTETSAGVTATSSSMTAGLAGAAGGYPLTLRTYAAVNVCTTSTADLAADAQFLRYAANAGQVSGTGLGQLPVGYAPLPAADRATTAKVAAALASKAKNPQCGTPKASASAPTGGTQPQKTVAAPSGGLGGGAVSGALNSGISAPTTSSSSPNATLAAPSKSPSADAAPGGITPTAYVSAPGRYGLLAALCFFVPCVIAGPTLLFAARNKP